MPGSIDIRIRSGVVGHTASASVSFDSTPHNSDRARQSRDAACRLSERVASRPGAYLLVGFQAGEVS